MQSATDESEKTKSARRNNPHIERALIACAFLVQAMNDYFETTEDDDDSAPDFPDEYDGFGIFWTARDLLSKFDSGMIGTHSGYLGQARQIEFPPAEQLAQLLLKPHGRPRSAAPRALAALNMLRARCQTHKERKAFQTLKNAVCKMAH